MKTLSPFRSQCRRVLAGYRRTCFDDGKSGGFGQFDCRHFSGGNNDNDKKDETWINPLSFVPIPSFGSTTATATTRRTTSIVAGAAGGLVTTSSGYTLSPLAITVLSNAPLAAFALVQASGLSPIKQIISEKKTSDLSPFPFISLYTNCAIWTLYGILTGDQTILVANAAGVIAGIIYTGIFANYTHLSMMKYYFGSFSLMGALLSSPYWIGNTENAIQLLGSFGCASAIILMASPLAVVNTVIKNESVDAMPLAVSLAMTLNGAAWGTYGWVVANDIYVWLPNGFGFVAGLLQLGLHAKYGRNNNNNNNNNNDIDNNSKNDNSDNEPKLKYSRHEK